MTAHALGSFEIKSWNEDQYSELPDGGKLTRASVTQEFTGDIEGAGDVEWLMCYRSDGTANIVGLQHFDGRIGDRTGSCVLQMTGTFDGSEARGNWFVVAGSGSGELGGIRGEGGMVAPLGQSAAAITLDYDFE